MKEIIELLFMGGFWGRVGIGVPGGTLLLAFLLSIKARSKGSDVMATASLVILISNSVWVICYTHFVLDLFKTAGEWANPAAMIATFEAIIATSAWSLTLSGIAAATSFALTKLKSKR